MLGHHGPNIGGGGVGGGGIGGPTRAQQRPLGGKDDSAPLNEELKALEAQMASVSKQSTIQTFGYFSSFNLVISFTSDFSLPI